MLISVLLPTFIHTGLCPSGLAWTGAITAIDTAHADYAECSNVVCMRVCVYVFCVDIRIFAFYVEMCFNIY